MEEENKIVEVEQQVEEKQENKEGRALKKWSLFFFIFCCIMLVMVASTLALPAIIILFGVASTICWLAFVLFVSVFTLGTIWLNEGLKAFNKGWMAFNETMFNAGETVFDKALSAVPYLIGAGSFFYLMAWLLIIIGACKDNNRKKFYKGMIIALAILTGLYIAASIVTVVAHQNK